MLYTVCNAFVRMYLCNVGELLAGCNVCECGVIDGVESSTSFATHHFTVQKLHSCIVI
jgi:hypothetical protein